jgi:hypothetical protein
MGAAVDNQSRYHVRCGRRRNIDDILTSYVAAQILSGVDVDLDYVRNKVVGKDSSAEAATSLLMRAMSLVLDPRVRSLVDRGVTSTELSPLLTDILEYDRACASLPASDAYQALENKSPLRFDWEASKRELVSIGAILCIIVPIILLAWVSHEAPEVLLVLCIIAVAIACFWFCRRWEIAFLRWIGRGFLSAIRGVRRLFRRLDDATKP